MIDYAVRIAVRCRVIQNCNVSLAVIDHIVVRGENDAVRGHSFGRRSRLRSYLDLRCIRDVISRIRSLKSERYVVSARFLRSDRNAVLLISHAVYLNVVFAYLARRDIELERNYIARIFYLSVFCGYCKHSFIYRKFCFRRLNGYLIVIVRVMIYSNVVTTRYVYNARAYRYRNVIAIIEAVRARYNVSAEIVRRSVVSLINACFRFERYLFRGDAPRQFDVRLAARSPLVICFVLKRSYRNVVALIRLHVCAYVDVSVIRKAYRLRFTVINKAVCRKLRSRYFESPDRKRIFLRHFGIERIVGIAVTRYGHGSDIACIQSLGIVVGYSDNEFFPRSFAEYRVLYLVIGVSRSSILNGRVFAAQADRSCRNGKRVSRFRSRFELVICFVFKR